MRNTIMELSKESSLLNVLKKNSYTSNKLTLAVISLFPMIFVTKTVEAALVFGLVVLVLLILTSLLVGLFKRIIASEIRLIFTMIVLVGLVMIFKLLLDAFIPNLANDFGIYIIMLGVSPVLYINLFHASENNYKTNLLESLGVGLGIILTLVLLALFREVLGTGMITFGRYLPISSTTLNLGLGNFVMANMLEPYGALIIFGFLLAIYVAIRQRNGVQDND